MGKIERSHKSHVDYFLCTHPSLGDGCNKVLEWIVRFFFGKKKKKLEMICFVILCGTEYNCKGVYENGLEANLSVICI